MTTKHIFSTALLTLLIMGCNPDSKVKDSTTKKVNGNELKNEEEFEQRMAAIDNNANLKLMNSLAYNNNEGSTIEAIASFNSSDQEVKIEESYSDVKSGNYGKHSFYIENGRKFATKEVYFDNGVKKPSFVERLSFYDQKGKVIFTKERFSDFEEGLEKEAFQISVPKDCPIDRAMRLLNQEGEFKTTFQGFVTDGNLKYLLVGENTKEGYASSLAVQYEEGDINILIKNERAYIGTPLEVEYETMVDERSLKFQILLSVRIKQ